MICLAQLDKYLLKITLFIRENMNLESGFFAGADACPARAIATARRNAAILLRYRRISNSRCAGARMTRRARKQAPQIS
jgi:hypothetical protein